MMLKKNDTVVKDFIEKEMTRLLKEKKGTSSRPKFNEHTPLFGGKSGLDSLDIAELIVSLEKKWGEDPFREGSKPVRTVGDLIRFYKGKPSKR